MRKHERRGADAGAQRKKSWKEGRSNYESRSRNGKLNNRENPGYHDLCSAGGASTGGPLKDLSLHRTARSRRTRTSAQAQ